jgi:hypothetical protein
MSEEKQLEELLKEHLQHVRHIELEVAGLLGFYGIFLLIFIEHRELYGLAFWISLAFLIITFKLDKELEKHWHKFRYRIEKLSSDKKEMFKEFLPLDKSFLYRVISVHRIITTIIIGLTTYFFVYMVSILFYDYWKELLSLIIAIIYLLFDAIRDWRKIKEINN